MRKITDTYSVEELFTEYIFSLMKQKKNFMVFPDNKQILIEDEVNEWNKNHGINNETKRILYHYVSSIRNPSGYAINSTAHISCVSVPYLLIGEDYNEFIKRVKKDLEEN